jgi:hypothetical protein
MNPRDERRALHRQPIFAIDFSILKTKAVLVCGKSATMPKKSHLAPAKPVKVSCYLIA